VLDPLFDKACHILRDRVARGNRPMRCGCRPARGKGRRGSAAQERRRVCGTSSLVRIPIEAPISSREPPRCTVPASCTPRPSTDRAASPVRLHTPGRNENAKVCGGILRKTETLDVQKLSRRHIKKVTIRPWQIAQRVDGRARLDLPLSIPKNRRAHLRVSGTSLDDRPPTPWASTARRIPKAAVAGFSSGIMAGPQVPRKGRASLGSEISNQQDFCRAILLSGRTEP